MPETHTPEHLRIALQTGVDIPARLLAPLYDTTPTTIGKWCRAGILPAYQHKTGQWYVRTAELTNKTKSENENEERTRISSSEGGKALRTLENERNHLVANSKCLRLCFL